MKPTLTRILLLTVFFASLASTAITGAYFLLFSDFANVISLESLYEIYPLGFEWTQTYRHFFLLRTFFIQGYVFVISGLILMLSIKREVPGRGYLVGFLAGWLLDWPRIFVVVYTNGLSISNMLIITNLVYIGYMIRLISLLFLMLQAVGSLKKSDRMLQLLVLVSFQIILLCFKIDITGIEPAATLRLFNVPIILGLTALVGLVLFLLPLTGVFSRVLRTKMRWNPISIFFIFLANTVLFLSYEWIVLLSFLLVLLIATLWLFYEVCIKYLWFTS
ncbi:MAG: hypothetical protein ACRCVN_06790 [Spirochaetia bacterium]